jgi:hypothetical protein
MPGSPFDIFSPFFFSAGEPSTVELVAPNISISLSTKHESLGNKPLQFLERKRLEIRKQSNLMRTAVTTLAKALLASFEVSYSIVKNKKPHTIGEPLLLPATMKMCEIMHGEIYAKLIKQFLSLMIQ